MISAYGSTLGTGRIRTQAEDFRVTELYDFEPTGKGEHLLLWIRKTGANTGWVANQLASHFGLRHFDVSYCGKKDRHAVTEQWFSCWLPGNPTLEMESIEIEGVEILRHVWHKRKLRRGEHCGNHFQLVIRDCVIEDKAALEHRLGCIETRGFPNYFGRQRFGHDGQNLEKACALVRDPAAQSRRQLDRKQKDIYVSALRSYLFNEALAVEVAADRWTDDDSLWVFGLSPHRDISIPRPAQHPAAVEFIETLGIKAHARPKRVVPQQLEWTFGDTMLTLSFDLPVGAYATTLLEAVLDIEDNHP